jgi:UDPglucose 6-dehydrogenase
MIGFAGLSHLGIVSSLAVAAKGFEVTGYDPDASLVGSLGRGQLPVVEPGLSELLTKHRAGMHLSADPACLRQCHVLYISSDVPTGPDGQSDLSAVHQLADTAVAHLRPGGVLVVLSQVPPGFSRGLAKRLEGSQPSAQLFYQVETLIFGRAVERALLPERYIVGCATPGDALPEAYGAFLQAWGCPILRMRYESAELAKISINMFLASSVCVTNTLAELCEAVSADWSEIVPALRLDRRIGAHAYLSPGLGLAGGNLERDLASVRALAQEFGTDAGVVDAWLTNSRHRRDWVLGLLQAEVTSRLSDPVIAVWGLAYKPNTKSTKNAPSLDLLEGLKPFRLRVYDPEVRLSGSGRPRLLQTTSAGEACRGADALAVMTPWEEFTQIKLEDVRGLMRGRVIVDPFQALDPVGCIEYGFRHFRLGAPERHA